MFVTAGSRRSSTADLFDALAGSYDQTGVAFFRPVAERLLDLAAPQPGERVLDIGCGRGAATLPLARAVGARGHVTAVDVAPKMVAATRAALARERLSHGEAHIGDAQRLRVGRGFELAVASLVLPLMDDPAAALRHWLGILAPGGRLALSTVDAVDGPSRAVNALFERWQTGGFSGSRPASIKPYELARLLVDLEAAGARTVETETEAAVLEFADIEDWRRFSMSTAQRVMWRRVPLEAQPDFLVHVERLLSGSRGPTGSFRIEWSVRYTLARR